MSKVIDNDDNGEWPNKNTAPSLPRSRKRLRDTEEYWNGPVVQNNATGWAEFVVDLELADEVGVVSPHKKRRGGVRSKPSGNNDASVPSLPLSRKRTLPISRKRPREKEGSFNDTNPRIENGPENKTAKGSAEFIVDLLELADEVETSVQQWRDSTREDRLSELADYRKIHGHCNVPKNCSENSKLAYWVGTQKTQYRFHREGKRSSLTLSRIQELEGLGFEWRSHGATWEERLSELANYRRIHGHCNVPKSISEHATLGNWVAKQRSNYGLQLEGKKSNMTLPRIQELESLGFEWCCFGATWEVRLSELADYRRIHGHCNVPTKSRENSKLGRWVRNQRSQYTLHREGKPSRMTAYRIQELESLGFDWRPSIGRKKEAVRKRSLNDGATRVHARTEESPEHMQQRGLKKIAAIAKSAAKKSTSLLKPNNPTGMVKSTSTSTEVEPKKIRSGEAGDARFDETDLELVVKPSLFSDKSLSPDKSAPAGDSVESNIRKDALQANLSWLAHQQQSSISFSHAILSAGPSNAILVAAKKPVNSRQSAESQVESAPSNAIFRATGYH
jgi:hypothetical protein